LLLTVGSALVAFQGVPGQATNGDLSSIELRQQSERAAQGDDARLAASDVLGERDGDGHEGASGDVFGVRASGSAVAGRFFGSNGRGQRDALRPGSRSTPLGERVPSSTPPGSTPPTALVGAPPVSTDDGSGSGSGPGSGSGSGSGSDTSSGTGSDSGSGSDAGSGLDTATGSDAGSGTAAGSGSGSESGSSSSGGSTSSDSGSAAGGTSGSDSSGSGTTTSGTGTDTVDETTDTVGSPVGVVSPGGAEANDGAGTAADGLLNDVTSAVGGLAG
jgi:hypothetical protein